MKLLLALFIFSFSTLAESMSRTQSGELRQRTNNTVSANNRLTSSTSAKLDSVRRAIQKSTSSNSLVNLAKLATKKTDETKSNKEIKASTPSKTKKLQFVVEPIFIDKNLNELTSCVDQDAQNAIWDGDAGKFIEVCKQLKESPRAKQELLEKAKQLRDDDPLFRQAIIELTKVEEKK